MNDHSEYIAPSTDLPPVIRRARFYQLTIYEISETELEILEKGSPDSIYLNFSIFLLSTAIAFTITLLTTDIITERLFNILFISTLLGYIGGVILLIIWFINRRSVSSCVDKIRNRLVPEGVQEDLED